MDVQTALSELLYNIENGDRQSSICSMQDLLEWMKRGGAMPEVQYVGTNYETGALSGWHVPQ